MIKTALALRYLVVVAILVALPVSSSAQLVIGQYEDEAPLRTWNTFGLATASAIGRGETMLAQADDCSAALSNPALLAGLPRLTLSVNGSYSRAQLFRYSIVNTGVLASRENLSIGLFALDFGGLSFRLKGWTFALTAALSEIYDRPQIYVETTSSGAPYYSLLFRQTGFLRTINVAVARGIGRRFEVGLGLNFVRGELERTVEDQFIQDGISISSQINQRFSGFYINGGLLAHITDRFDLAAAFRTAYDKNAEDSSELRYQAPAAGTDILISGASDDIYHQPWAAGLGARYELTPKFRLLGDLAYFHWSGYKVTYFGETQSRDFGAGLKAALGGEFTAPVRLFKKEASIPLRLGLGYDKQPMRDSKSAYTLLTAGAGFHIRMFHFDAAGEFGRESGSGHDLEVMRVSVSLGLRL
jgi:Outer membrane protein transport protein (OMPP1/FadL/TodX)